MFKRKTKQKMIFIVLALLMIILFWLDINAGYTPVRLSDFVDLLFGHANPSIRLTVVNFRLPRVLMSLLVGMGLSVSGTVLHGVRRNELADPGVLGINAGAGLMVAVFISFFPMQLQDASLAIPFAAFAGGMVVFFLVYALANDKKEEPPPQRLVLTGVAIANAVNAVMIMLLLRMRQDEYGFIAGWLAGNIWGANWPGVQLIAPWILLLLLFVWYKANDLILTHNWPKDWAFQFVGKV